jgi:hypothetical protein
MSVDCNADTSTPCYACLQVRQLSQAALHSELQNVFRQMTVVRSMAHVIYSTDASQPALQYSPVHPLTQAVVDGTEMVLQTEQGRSLLQQRDSTSAQDPCDPSTNSVTWTPDSINPTQSESSKPAVQ